ncbi:Hypothetical Protein OBI_RACECAR_39 [Arthrobacter phage Racecar]|nr:hypothetical protein PBI_RACECAR_120 [Arthrobacter phage Racecar]QFG12795.1 hypothetical protein PBI_MIMI_117 [Arthrobacter phage Mimi]
MARPTETPRSEIEALVIYEETSTGQYFFSPDGVGCFWYDTLEEAQEQHGDTGDVLEVEKLSDF